MAHVTEPAAGVGRPAANAGWAHRWCNGLVVLTTLSLSHVSLGTEPPTWPQFLGPHRNGISSETGLNLDWKTRQPPPVWKVPLGPAFSSLAVIEERIFTLAKRGNRDGAVCLDARTGRELWFRDLAPTYLDAQRQGAGPRSTPTYHAGRVYCLLPLGDLFCLNAADGATLWKTNILEATGAPNRAGEFYFWGLSASPLIEGEFVIVQPGGKQNRSVVALHRDTGKLVWGAGEDPACYASPIVITAAGRRQLVCPTGQSILGLDPVKGDVLWRYPFGNRFEATCATPVWADNQLFVSAAYGTGCAGMEIVAEGNRLTARAKWQHKNLQNLMATSIVHEGHVYGCHGDLGNFFFRCLELATGKPTWEMRMPGRFALVAAEAHLFCWHERGSLRLIEANPTRFVLKGEIENLLAFKAWAMPVLVNRKLYLRDERQLLCLDLGK